MSRQPLNVAVIGAGIGGLSAAIALRRQGGRAFWVFQLWNTLLSVCAGHKVSLYERFDFAGEIGASLSCAKNGTMWLEEWKVSVSPSQAFIGVSLHGWSCRFRLQKPHPLFWTAYACTIMKAESQSMTTT